MKTVYFLGAGASKAILETMPTAGELTVEHLLQPENYPNGDPPRTAIPQLREAITNGELRPEFKDLRLEEALSRIWGNGRYAVETHNLVLCLVRRLGMPESFMGTSGPLELFLWAAQENGDGIITTNYDTLVEASLMNMGSLIYRSRLDAVDVSCGGWIDLGVRDGQTGPDHGDDAFHLLGRERGSLPLLKLHGSISWNECAACGYINLDLLHNFGAESAMDGWGRCPQPGCGSENLRTILVPPTVSKSYDRGVIREIRSSTERLLAGAERLVFAGFSLHPSDGGIRDLLRGATHRGRVAEVMVVDPFAEQIADRYRELFGEAVNPLSADWAKYLRETFTLQDFEARMERRRRKLLGVNLVS